jgi:hypothetical protein
MTGEIKPILHKTASDTFTKEELLLLPLLRALIASGCTQLKGGSFQIHLDFDGNVRKIELHSSYIPPR